MPDAFVLPIQISTCQNRTSTGLVNTRVIHKNSSCFIRRNFHGWYCPLWSPSHHELCNGEYPNSSKPPRLPQIEKLHEIILTSRGLALCGPEQVSSKRHRTENLNRWTCCSRLHANQQQPCSDKLPSSSTAYLVASGVLGGMAVAFPALCALFVRTNAKLSVATAIAPEFLSHYGMLAAISAFGLVHSGLAALRPELAAAVGQRLYRVFFALVSIPAAVATIAYFIAHRYDGIQLWRLQGVVGLHEFCFVLAFVSFLFLYPATFNLLEVAAVKRPSFRIYESGIMRISRHPQLWGQIIWCIAHSAWMGTSMSVEMSLALVAYHCFGVWNGDRRLRDHYGSEWEKYEQRTSVLPFKAIFDGKQTLNLDEFPLLTYAGVVIFILVAYGAHPTMLRAVANLRW